MSGAPVSRVKHSSDEFENEKAEWSTESCVSSNFEQVSAISNETSMLSREIVPKSEPPENNAEFPNELSRKENNADFPNELRKIEQVGLDSKERLHYLSEEEWPLLGSHGAGRWGGLAPGKPTSPGATREAGNDEKTGTHMVPLSVKTHQHESGKNMHTCSVVDSRSFKDRTKSTHPYSVLGAWLDKLTPSELRLGFEEMDRWAGKAKPPTTQSMSIMIKAKNNIDNRGQTVRWEAIELWVMGKRVTPYPLPTRDMDQCVLVPSVNQSLAKKGLPIDQIVLNRHEFNGPAARLNFQPQHCLCRHSYSLFQWSARTRLGYAVLQPVLNPPPPNELSVLQ